MFGLDGIDALSADSLGLILGVGDSVTAFDEARASAEAVEIPFPPDAIRNVVLCGMGGSAIAGDLILGAVRERMTRPMTVVRDYSLPGWVGEDTLVILSSYSGGTEETLSCAMDAIDRTPLCVAITNGGTLGAHYAERGVPIIPVPPGLQPRAALIRLLVPVAVLLHRLGLVPSLEAELAEARATIESGIATLGPQVNEESNPAKQLARSLHGGIPLFWGAEMTAPVAVRWKGQINENAKLPAFASTLPELDHNEIVGFEGMPSEMHSLARLVMLRDPHHHRQVERRFDLTRDLVSNHVSEVFSITAEGDTALARMLDLVMLGDYVSLYLALLRAVDPGPVDIITRLKEMLAESGGGRAAAVS